jgi:hypothetical protein
MAQFTITQNPQSGVYSCNPSSQSISKSAGVTFHTSVACRVCLANSNVFGVSSIDLAVGDKNPPVTGAIGASSGFHIQDAGTTCQPQVTEDEPFLVTIGSSEGEPEAEVQKGKAPHHQY